LKTLSGGEFGWGGGEEFGDEKVGEEE